MSRYLVLIILNIPLIMIGVLSAIVSYKLKHSSQRRLMFRITLWMVILAGLVFAEPLYKFLFSHNLTKTEPLSLFDVIQITGIIFTLFIANRAHVKADLLERRLQDIHQELSIKLSQK